MTLYQGLQQVLGKKKTILQADGCNWWNRADSKDIEQAVKADTAMKNANISFDFNPMSGF